MSTKLSIEQASELFKKMEMEVVVVADSEEADKTPDLDAMSKAAFSEMEAKITDTIGADLKAEARKEESGKQLGSLRRVLKRNYGVDEKEIAEMSMEDMIKFVKDKTATNKTDADGDLMKRYEELQRDLEAKDSDWQKKYEARESELMNQFQMRDIEERVLNVVNGIPRVGGDPVRQAKAIVQELQSRYVLKLNDNKEIELYDKTNPEKKVFDGKNVVTDKYAVDKYLTEIGVRATDTRNINPKDVLDGKKVTVQAGAVKVDESDPIAFLEAAMSEK